MSLDSYRLPCDRKTAVTVGRYVVLSHRANHPQRMIDWYSLFTKVYP